MPWFFYDSNGNQLTAERGTQSVADGGTGATSLTDGGVLLGSGTGAITAMAVLADGAMIVGDGTTDPVAETGTTLRTSIGVGTGDSPTFTAVTVPTVTGASTITLDATTDIVLDADGGDIFFKDGGATFGSATNTSGNLIVKSGTTTALTFAGANITAAGTIGSGAITSTGVVTATGFTIGSAAITEAELELLDGATSLGVGLGMVIALGG